MANMFDKTRYALQKIGIGELCVPSGKLYCCDPFLSEQVNALDRQISPGRYGVNLWLGNFEDWGRRIALAELVISSEQAEQREIATYTKNNRPMSGFEVNAGLACFMDEQTRIMFWDVFNRFYDKNPNGNYYDDILAEEFRKQGGQNGSRKIGDWNLHYPVKECQNNIAMFASGIGDGFYEAYWALDERGEAVSLIADFKVVEI